MEINSPFVVNEESEKLYMKGKLNFLVRLYYYLQQGFNQINSAHSVILGLVAIALLFHFNGNYKMIAIIGVLSVPFIVLLGWFWADKGMKPTEYFTMKKTSVYGRYGVQMTERNLQQNDEIISLLKQLLTK